MGRMIEVHVPLVPGVVTLEYSVQRLLASPIELAKAAIAQEEAAYMSEFYAGRVLEDIFGLLLVDALYRKPLDDHFQTKRLGRVVCNYVEHGRADWTFSLRCDERGGSGSTYTVSNKRVPCPDCDEGGVVAEAFFETDLDSRFLKWGNSGTVDIVLNYGHGTDAPRLVARPEAEALAMVAGWWS